ncbi:DNA-binding protein [Thermoplasmatales archaeon SW_10_69_26]|nr:MAG: DNA-binding protein [Thermoplasmatales archaeon SW_10_69_26]
MDLRRCEDRIIAGVCAGLAQRLGVEAMVLRTLYAASLVLFGLGLPLYVVLYLPPPA